MAAGFKDIFRVDLDACVNDDDMDVDGLVNRKMPLRLLLLFVDDVNAKASAKVFALPVMVMTVHCWRIIDAILLMKNNFIVMRNIFNFQR